jgi:hypothetical protein
MTHQPTSQEQTMTQVFGPGRPAAAFHAISRLDALEIEAVEWCGFGPAGFYERLDAARQERAHYWEYADVNAAQACL